jgi:hypothetical protein
MVARAAAAIIGLIFLASLVFVGVVCAAFAIDAALTNIAGVSGAAAITALIFLAGPVIALLVFALRRPRESALMQLLSTFSRSSPLVAILGAGALGLAESLLKKKKRD